MIEEITKKTINPIIEDFMENLRRNNKFAPTVSKYSYNVKRFLIWLLENDCTVEQKKAMNYLRTLKGGTANYNGVLSAIKEYCRYYELNTEGDVRTYFHLIPALKPIKTEDHQREALELPTLKSIILAAKIMQSKKSRLQKRNGLILELIATRGLRTVEVTRLKPKDIKEDYILIHGKGQQVTEKDDLTVRPELCKALVEYSKESKGPYIFEDRNGNQLDTSVIRRFIKGVLSKHLPVDDLNHYNAHGFRHTLTQIYYSKSLSMLNEAPQPDLMKRLLRHKDTSVMAQNYLGAAGDTQRRNDPNRIETKIDYILGQ